MKAKHIILIIVMVIAVGALVYFISNYKSPAQIQAERAANEIKIQNNQDILVLIENYLALSENETINAKGLSDLQDQIIATVDLLETYEKNGLSSFISTVKAIRTIISMENDELRSKLME